MVALSDKQLSAIHTAASNAMRPEDTSDRITRLGAIRMLTSQTSRETMARIDGARERYSEIITDNFGDTIEELGFTDLTADG